MRAERVRGRDVERRLCAALAANAAAAGCTLAVEQCRGRPWSSATFVGEQLALVMLLDPADAAAAWLAALAEADLPVRGHVAMPPAVDRVEPAGIGLRVRATVLVLSDD